MEEDSSQFSLSEIWDDKTLNGLDRSQSYDSFTASQPVLRLKSPTPSPPLMQQDQGLVSVAIGSSVVGSVLRLKKDGSESDGNSSLESSISNTSQPKETTVLGIQKSPDTKRVQSEEEFVSTVSFIPIVFSDYTPSLKTHEETHVPKRIMYGDGDADLGEIISLRKSSSSLSESDNSSMF